MLVKAATAMGLYGIWYRSPRPANLHSIRYSKSNNNILSKIQNTTDPILMEGQTHQPTWSQIVISSAVKAQ